MSTHNICFYEEMVKIFFQLSSNIIKYLFCSDSSLFCCFFSQKKIHAFEMNVIEQVDGLSFLL